MPPKCMLTIVRSIFNISLSIKSHKLLFFIKIPWSWRMKADVRKHILSTINPWMVWIGVSMSMLGVSNLLIKRDWMLILDSANEILTMSPVSKNVLKIKSKKNVNNPLLIKYYYLIIIIKMNWQIGWSIICRSRYFF